MCAWTDIQGVPHVRTTSKQQETIIICFQGSQAAGIKNMLSDLWDCYLLRRIIKRKLLLPKRTKYSSNEWESDSLEPATRARPRRSSTSWARSTTGGSISWTSWQPGKGPVSRTGVRRMLTLSLRLPAQGNPAHLSTFFIHVNRFSSPFLKNATCNYFKMLLTS